MLFTKTDCDCVWHGHGHVILHSFHGACQSPCLAFWASHLLESFLKCTKANIKLTKVIQDHQGGSGWLFHGWRTSHSSTIVDPDNFAMMFFVWRKTCAQSDANEFWSLKLLLVLLVDMFDIL